MATGISTHEKHSIDATVAQNMCEQTMLLPSNSEKIELVYPGKASETQILQPMDRSFSMMGVGEATDLQTNIPLNSFGLMDNYFGLHDILASGKKVNLFYLDPPYGTGMDFQSRDLKHAYNDKMGPATFVEFMRRRLILMRECLAEDGSIYVHIGHQMLAHLKVVMDEVFGAKNFQNIITRRKCSSKNFTRNQFPNLNDFVLFYTKGSTFKWAQPGTTPPKEWVEKEYPKTDQFGRKFKLVPIHAPGTRRGETGKEWRGMMPPPGKHWQYVPEKLEKLEEQGDIHWSKNGNPRRKVYWSDDKQIALTDYWEGFRDAHHQSIKITGYPTEKNLEMIKMIVAASSEPGDFVVDPFCGSGTTLQAARDLGRDFVGFDASFTAAASTLQRMRHGVEAMGDYVNKNENLKQGDILSNATQGPNKIKFLVDSALLDSNHRDIIELSRT